MRLERIGEDQFGVTVIELTLIFGDCLVARFADVACPVFFQVDQTDDGHSAELVRHAVENLGAVEVQLTGSDLKQIEDATSKLSLEGARLPEAMLKMTGR